MECVNHIHLFISWKAKSSKLMDDTIIEMKLQTFE